MTNPVQIFSIVSGLFVSSYGVMGVIFLFIDLVKTSRDWILLLLVSPVILIFLATGLLSLWRGFSDWQPENVLDWITLVSMFWITVPLILDSISRLQRR